MTLRELTGHEAGIIVFENGDVIIADWNQCDDDCVPVLAPAGDMVINFPREGYIERGKESNFGDIRPILQGKTVLLDEFNDIERLMSDKPDKYGMMPDRHGKKYIFEDGTEVYTFADWN